MYSTLYEILVEARAHYDTQYSPYICDCITRVEDELHQTQPTRKLLDFVKDDIKGAYSVNRMLFPGHHGLETLNKAQRDQVLKYREGLWQRLFDEFAS